MKLDELLTFEIGAPEETDLQLLAALDLEQAARYLDLEDWIVNRLRRAAREITVQLPLGRDDGSEATLTGFRVQHGGAGHPALGPVELAPDTDLRRLRATAMNLTWQMSLLELPFRGAAGAVICDPQHMSERELRIAVMEYATALGGLIGATSDVLAPGAGCNEQTMAWMLAATAREMGRDPQTLASVVGKPAVLWGISEHHRAAAAGTARLLRMAWPDKDMTVAIQGFSPSAQALAKSLKAINARLVGVADGSGALLEAAGLDADKVCEHAARQGMLFGYAEASAVTNAELLECDCDVLVLDAAERQISTANVERVGARVVVECVDGAVTRRAEERLAANGVRFVPYLLGAASKAVTAAVEWERNTTVAPAPFSGAVIEDYVARMYRACTQRAADREMSLRPAAMIAAVERLAAQMRLGGRD